MAADGARVAVVTGASSVIGLHVAADLARAGLRVVMTGRDAGRTEFRLSLPPASWRVSGSQSSDYPASTA